MPQHDAMWAVDGISTPAVEARLALQTLTDGRGGVATAGAFAVTPNGSMTLRVAAGRAVVPITSLTFNGSVHVVLDTDDTALTVGTTTSGQYRRDSVILEVLPTGTPWTWRRRVVAGTAAGSANTAVQPATPANSILLATLLIPPLTTSAVTTGMITDARGYATTTAHLRAHLIGGQSYVNGVGGTVTATTIAERVGAAIDHDGSKFTIREPGLYTFSAGMALGDFNGNVNPVYVRADWMKNTVLHSTAGGVGFTTPGYGGLAVASVTTVCAVNDTMSLSVIPISSAFTTRPESWGQWMSCTRVGYPV